VFDGPAPEVSRFVTAQQEEDAIGLWIKARAAQGVAPHEIAVFVRSSDTLERAKRALTASGFAVSAPQPGVDLEPGPVVLLPMHLAKGLEFRAVVVACCDADELPHSARLKAVSDDADLEEVYDSERHLLYVACTRARVTAVDPASEFLDDF